MLVHLACLLDHDKKFSFVCTQKLIQLLFLLQVLETCVKNCGKRFHILVTSKDFVQELIKLIGPKNDPPAAIQEKVRQTNSSFGGPA